MVLEHRSPTDAHLAECLFCMARKVIYEEPARAGDRIAAIRSDDATTSLRLDRRTLRQLTQGRQLLAARERHRVAATSAPCPREDPTTMQPNGSRTVVCGRALYREWLLLAPDPYGVPIGLRTCEYGHDWAEAVPAEGYVLCAFPHPPSMIGSWNPLSYDYCYVPVGDISFVTSPDGSKSELVDQYAGACRFLVPDGSRELKESELLLDGHPYATNPMRFRLLRVEPGR